MDVLSKNTYLGKLIAYKLTRINMLEKKDDKKLDKDN